MPPSPGVACRNCRYSDESEQETEVPCPACRGKGEVNQIHPDQDRPVKVRCHHCGGSKKVMDKAMICRRVAPSRVLVAVWPIVLPTDWCGEYDPRRSG